MPTGSSSSGSRRSEELTVAALSRRGVDTLGAFSERRGGGRVGHDRAMQPPITMTDRFNAIADRFTRALGSLQALVGSVLLVVIWAVTGPVFNFSGTWQLFINTTTTVITFWMVFVIQNSANREAKATQLKLDELIRAVADARNEFIALDRAPEEILVEREKELDDVSPSIDTDSADVAHEAQDAHGNAPRDPGDSAGGQRPG
jgi:low affinity Fe/Cu permease